jgi:hypothetical protein
MDLMIPDVTPKRTASSSKASTRSSSIQQAADPASRTRPRLAYLVNHHDKNKPLGGADVADEEQKAEQAASQQGHVSRSQRPAFAQGAPEQDQHAYRRTPTLNVELTILATFRLQQQSSTRECIGERMTDTKTSRLSPLDDGVSEG